MKKKHFFKFNIESFFLIVLLTVSSVFLAFSGGSFILNFKQIGFSVTSTIENAFHLCSSSIGDTVSAVTELIELKAQYSELAEKLKNYELLERSNADIKRENQELRMLLKLSENISIKNISAEVIGYDPNGLYSGLIVNRGVKHGILKDMPVVSFQNGSMALVGKIVQVGKFTSMVIPIYDYQCHVAAKMELEKHRGIVNGQGFEEAALLMRYVKKRAEADIKIGDKVVTSGFDDNSIFPKNIPIGFVSKIKVHEYENSLELYIEPIIDFSSLEYVFILDAASSGNF